VNFGVFVRIHRQTRCWNPKSWSQELLSLWNQASFIIWVFIQFIQQSVQHENSRMVHILGLLNSLTQQPLIVNSDCYKAILMSPSTWGMCSFKKWPYLWFSSSVHLRSDVLSYNIAVCNVSASRLAGSDDLHNLTSSEAIVPSNRIRNLYSWKLFEPMHSEKGRVTNLKGC